MPVFTGGGASSLTGANIVDASLSRADLAASADNAYSPIALTLLPRPNATWDNLTTYDTTPNTTMRVGQVVIEQEILVNKVSILTAGKTTNGAIQFALYSENGATRILTGTTGTISVTHTATTVTLGAAVLVPAGVYYWGVVSVGTADVQMAVFGDTSAGVQGDKIGIVSGEPVLSGTLTVSAGTVPATITPTAITSASNCTAVFRLDN